MKNLQRIFAGFLCAFLFAACGSKEGQVTLNVLKSANASRASLINNPILENLGFRVNVGSSTAAQLSSLKYIFGSIQICESVTTNGSAFSNPTGCLSIYSGPTIGDGSSGAVTPTTLSTYASSQIDMMDDTSRAKLNSSASVKSDNVRSYNYAIINWYTPIAVKGTLTTAAGTLVTRAATSYTANNVANVGNMTTGSAEESVVVSANGGSFFKFQTPFTISQADVDAQTGYVIDMAFNPDSVIAGQRGGVSTAPTFSGQMYDSASSSAIYVPMLNMIPVPRKSSDVSKKETYDITLTGLLGKTRVELYYNGSDSTKSITGVNLITALSTTTTSGSYSQIDNGAKIASVEVAANGTLTLKDNSSPANSIITGLKREANSTVNVTYVGGTGSGGQTGLTSTYISTTTVN